MLYASLHLVQPMYMLHRPYVLLVICRLFVLLSLLYVYGLFQYHAAHTLVYTFLFIEPVDSIYRDSADIQYMIIQKISKSYKPL